MKHFHLTSFLLGLALGALFACVWFFGDSFMPQLPAVSGIATSTVTSSITTDTGTIDVQNQAAGDAVLVASVTVPPPGAWVAIRETGIGRELGHVLGATRVRGPAANVSVTLLRPTYAGRIYAVQLYRADDDGPFDAETGSAYIDFDTGARAIALFTAQ